MKVETKPPEFPASDELKEKFWNDPRFERAFEALTPGRQGGYLIHFTSAQQSGMRTAQTRRRCLRSSKDEGSWAGNAVRTASAAIPRSQQGGPEWRN